MIEVKPKKQFKSESVNDLFRQSTSSTNSNSNSNSNKSTSISSSTSLKKKVGSTKVKLVSKRARNITRKVGSNNNDTDFEKKDKSIEVDGKIEPSLEAKKREEEISNEGNLENTNDSDNNDRSNDNNERSKQIQPTNDTQDQFSLESSIMKIQSLSQSHINTKLSSFRSQTPSITSSISIGNSNNLNNTIDSYNDNLINNLNLQTPSLQQTHARNFWNVEARTKSDSAVFWNSSQSSGSNEINKSSRNRSRFFPMNEDGYSNDNNINNINNINNNQLLNSNESQSFESNHLQQPHHHHQNHLESRNYTNFRTNDIHDLSFQNHQFHNFNQYYRG